jgi:hypothetical protein
MTVRLTLWALSGRWVEFMELTADHYPEITTDGFWHCNCGTKGRKPGDQQKGWFSHFQRKMRLQWRKR